MKAARRIVLTLLIVVPAAAGWFAFDRRESLFGSAGPPSADSARPGPGGAGPGRGGGPVRVVTQAVEIDDSGEDVRSIGTLAAAQEVTLYPEVTGVVAEILFTANEKVKAGDVLVRLDDEDQKVEVERATIVRDDARAALDRAEKLFATKNVTTVTVADAKSAERKAGIDLKIAQLALAKRTIDAPFAGFVGITDLSVGDLVTTAKAIANLADMSTVTVTFEIPERVAGRVAVGQSVSAATAALPGRAFNGAVSAIDNRLDASSRTLKVEAELPNDANVLKPGMSVATVLNFPGEARPMVSSLAVQWDRKGSFVWKLEGDVARRTPAEIIARRSGSVILAADLQKGDEVVVEGVQRLREGATVARADNANSSPAPAAETGKPSGPGKGGAAAATRPAGSG